MNEVNEASPASVTSDVERVVKCYRCGYCGRPTDENGVAMIELPSDMTGYETADTTHGDCCRYEQEREMVQVTREMAMDAQDMRLEGQWIEW